MISAICTLQKSGKVYMKKIRIYLNKIIPAYGVFPLLFSFIFNSLVYAGARVIAGGWHHYNIESTLDMRFPFIPQFLIIYLGCYIFWIINYILAARQDKKSVYQFFTADFISRCICFVIFLVFPTTNTRPEITGGGFWNQAISLLYIIDAADNLFPSIHCLVSWFCYLGVREQKNIPVWYKRTSLVLAVLVFISTLATKQHVIVDVVSGVLLAQICYLIGKKTKLYKIYEKATEKITERIDNVLTKDSV